MDTMRLFAGIALPQAHQELVGALQPQLAAMARGAASWTRPGNAHVTLHFLGSIARERVAAVTTALSAVRFAAFALQPGGGGFFPGPSRPRVVWVGMTAGAGACARLAAAVGAALAGVGCPPPPQPFSAHVTLGRLKAPGQGGDWPGMLAFLRRAAWPAVRVEAFTLFASQLSAAGPLYTAAARFGAVDA
ncbi:RNA 2',3'-cyclic phosphodiesterase [Solidesulfovibrio sp.]